MILWSVAPQAPGKEAGWQIAEDSWFSERYNCPRFTTPDEKGKVVLDYCFYLKDE